MAKSKKERYKVGRERIEESNQISNGEKDLIIEFLDANDPDRHMVKMPDEKNKSYGTLSNYAQNVYRIATHLEMNLSEATTNDLNHLMDGYLNGEVVGVKDEGLSNGTVRTIQGAIRKFYTYHDDLEVDPEDIHYADLDKSPVDERDMFTSEEVQSLREQAKQMGTRDACLVDLLLYTGQRQSAIINLRLKDVDADEGVFWLNEEAGDLKGASGKRPLLGALQSVRNWKRQHPTEEPEDHLITHKHATIHKKGAEPGDKLGASTVYRQLQRIGKAAEVEKPVNAHNFRHYFVTACKRDYGMDDATVKHLIGHSPESKVMETTYQHLTDDDYIKDAEEEYGIREPDNESPLTPAVCDRCNEPLDNDWKSCPYCGMIYSPDVYDAKEQAENTLWEGKSEAEPGSSESEGIDALREVLNNNPEAVSELLKEVE